MENVRKQERLANSQALCIWQIKQKNFILLLKGTIDGADRTWFGKELQADWPEIENDRSPNFLVLETTSLSWLLLVERRLERRLDSWTLVQKLMMWSGANPWRALYTSMQHLYWIVCGTRGQSRLSRRMTVTRRTWLFRSLVGRRSWHTWLVDKISCLFISRNIVNIRNFEWFFLLS